MASSLHPMKDLARRILTLLVLLVVAMLIIHTFVRQNVYPKPAIRVPSPPPAPLVEVRVESSEGDEIVAWLDEATSEEATSDEAPSILFFHGNGENLATLEWSGAFEDFRTLDGGAGSPAVLAVDYPGYGRSTGRPGEDANVAAAVAAHRWLREHRPDAPLVVMGWSLGAAVAAQLVPRVGRDEIDALVLASAWHDLAGVAKDHFPGFLIDLFLREKYDSGDALETALAASADDSAPLPVLVIHGAGDRMIRPRHGRRLFERLETAGADAEWVAVEGAGHNDLMASERPWCEVGELLRRVLPPE